MIDVDLFYILYFYPLYFRLSRLQEVIAEQCEVAAVNQILVVDGELLEHTVDPLAPVSDYPACITEGNPIFVFLKSYPDHRYFPNCVYRKFLLQTFFGSIWTYILSLSLKKVLDIIIWRILQYKLKANLYSWYKMLFIEYFCRHIWCFIYQKSVILVPKF